jgi:hypothetical protein
LYFLDLLLTWSKEQMLKKLFRFFLATRAKFREKEIRLEELVDIFFKSFIIGILHYSYLLLLLIGINTTVNTILSLE